MNKTVHSGHHRHNKVRFYLIEIVLVLTAIVLFVVFGKWNARFDEQKWTENYVATKEAASELQFFVYSDEEWEQFFDVYQESYLTNEMVSGILSKLGVAEVIPFEGKGRQRAVTRTEWYKIYAQVLDYLDIEDHVAERDLLILAKEQQEEDAVLYTNEGIFYTALPISYFNEWESYKAYFIEDICVGLEKELETEAIISNTYITSGKDGAVSFLFQGKTYYKKANLGEQEVTEGVADLTVRNSEIITIGQKQDYIVGNLLSYDDTTIEVEGYGRIAHQGNVPVYQVYGDVEEQSISDIVIGNMEVKYIIGINEVCAIIMTAPAEINDVRVLLLAEDGDKFREEVYLTSDCGFQLSCGDFTQIQAAGTLICAADYINSREETLTIVPEAESGYLYVCDASGKKISNAYSGNMEVREYENGYCVVNEVPFETYLYSVVPSEMPSNYQPEALKAQAVCARSYAYIQVMRADLAAYGAHINDSSSYQVYNNIAKSDASVRAVEETAGIVMLYEGDVVEAYYFSTSMGYTDTVEVWNVQDTEPYGYLKQACLNQTMFSGDLSTEEGFKEYLQTDMIGYDSNIKFYRWQIRCEDYAAFDEEILVLLEYRKEASDRHITYYEGESETEVGRTQNFGKMLSVEVAERSKAGSILKLKINFENGYIIVENEYNIRKVLGCAAQNITYQNGSTAECSSLIPSAFCTVERQEDGTYLLCGGGYGHGLGMSQNGANGLAKSGYTYEEILHFFYKDIELVDIRD